MTLASTVFASPFVVFLLAFLLRAILLVYGIYQDSVSAIKYTDIDYYVFTDAARAAARGRSPYDRATYRYTPLLAWILIPSTWGGLWFHFGKAIFALSDLIAGWFIMRILRRQGYSPSNSLKYASVWLLNPMVANISTRGSSEGLLCVLVMALLWSFTSYRIILSGVLLGLSVHFKIYPFVYGISLLYAMEPTTSAPSTALPSRFLYQLTKARLTLFIISLLTFTALNTLMYYIYGPSFVQHTFTHHLTRIDHRHNFSPWNTLLYLSSASCLPTTSILPIKPESLAFLPQLLLSTILIPISLTHHSLPNTLLTQTLAFVTFNKVCTSQYFLWYLIFLPLYLPTSSLISNPRKGLAVLAAWVIGQAIWLYYGYQLEFLGKSTFVPGLWLSSLGFFGVNCMILAIVVEDSLSLPRRGGYGAGSKGEQEFELKEGLVRKEVKPDREASVSGTSIGKSYIGPRNRVLKSTPIEAG